MASGAKQSGRLGVSAGTFRIVPERPVTLTAGTWVGLIVVGALAVGAFVVSLLALIRIGHILDIVTGLTTAQHVAMLEARLLRARNLSALIKLPDF